MLALLLDLGFDPDERMRVGGSTVHDLYLWDQALYTERLLPAKTRNLLFRPNLESYGYGWGILIPKPDSPYAGESIPMHGGAIFGFRSLIQRIPSRKELVVLLDNTDSLKLLDIAFEIQRVLSASQSVGSAILPE